jgi:lysophospholipase L1-like esterase
LTTSSSRLPVRSLAARAAAPNILMRKLAFIVAASGLSLFLCVLMLLLLDTWVHHKFDEVAGINRWGYRGPVAGAKRQGEFRIVTLGGSTVLGWGIPSNDAWPAQLEERLKRRDPKFSVINLGYNNDGAYAMLSVLEDYAYLRPDLVILYEGYNDLTSFNTNMFRRQSSIFRLTGYFPLLPVVAREKAMALRSNDIHAAYRQKTTFRPNVMQRVGASTLETGVAIAASLDRQLNQVIPNPSTTHQPVPTKLDVVDAYCESIARAIVYARARGNSVLVVGQPHISEGHARQQRVLREFLANRFGHDRLVQYFDAARTVDLTNLAIAPDGMHLGREGYGMVADALTGPVLDLALEATH